ncbi:hypothetical protein E4U43_004061 [Claviceps pusilla]|uniref:Uncharacterized protein n=1 Tax=Claviceps pusilla TaxID=123648 RepID=A0A9P7NHM5_9HYPO|nr:hypothetical protein E4U43_004061 [Claviceps pusilla]
MSDSVPVSGDLAAHESQHHSCNEDSGIPSVTSYEEPWREVGAIFDDDEALRWGLGGPMDDNSMHLYKMFRKILAAEKKRCEDKNDTLRSDVMALNEKLAAQVARIEELELNQEKLQLITRSNVEKHRELETLTEKLDNQKLKIRQLEENETRLQSVINDNAELKRDLTKTKETHESQVKKLDTRLRLAGWM